MLTTEDDFEVNILLIFGASFMKAIILSAGQGKRLLPLTSKRPKCLLDILGKTVLEWQVETLAGAGIGEIVVVTGYGAEKVDNLVLGRLSCYGVRTLYNPEYATSDNLVSCWKVRHEMDGDFVLLNGDTLFEPGVIERLLGCKRASITVTVSSKARYDSDDMKVITEKDRLVRIGKELSVEKVSAESIGLIYFRDDGPGIFKHALEDALKDPESRKRWYLSVIDSLAARQPVMTCSITGLKWCEIDYPKDLKFAEEVVAAIHHYNHVQGHRGIYARETFMHAKRHAG